MSAGGGGRVSVTAAQQGDKALRVRTDGASRGNPGQAGIGVVIERAADGAVVDEIAQYLGQATNNVAEYRALIVGLTRALDLGATAVEVVSDSELLVRQVEGRYQVKHPGLIPLFEEVRRLRRRFSGGLRISHTLRGGNKRADELANEAIDRALGRGGRGAGATAPAGGAVPQTAEAQRVGGSGVRVADGATEVGTRGRPERPGTPADGARPQSGGGITLRSAVAERTVVDAFALALTLEAGQAVDIGGGVRVARVRSGQARVSGWTLVLRGGIDVGGRVLEPGQSWRGGVRYRAVGEEDAVVLETDSPA